MIDRVSVQEKQFIEKRSKMTYQEIINVGESAPSHPQEMNSKLEKQTDHNDLPRIAAAGLG